MGYVNLYTDELNDDIVEFVGNYKEGVLRPVLAIKLLELKPRPYAYLRMAVLDHDYIIFHVSKEISDQDVGWLYKKIVVEHGENIDRRVMMDYSIYRVLGKQYVGRRIANRQRWDDVRQFRRALEIPAMALRQFAERCVAIEDHVLDRSETVVAIQYQGKKFDKTLHRRAVEVKEPATA